MSSNLNIEHNCTSNTRSRFLYFFNAKKNWNMHLVIYIYSNYFQKQSNYVIWPLKSKWWIIFLMAQRSISSSFAPNLYNFNIIDPFITFSVHLSTYMLDSIQPYVLDLFSNSKVPIALAHEIHLMWNKYRPLSSNWNLLCDLLCNA